MLAGQGGAQRHASSRCHRCQRSRQSAAASRGRQARRRHGVVVRWRSDFERREEHASHRAVDHAFPVGAVPSTHGRRPTPAPSSPTRIEQRLIALLVLPRQAGRGAAGRTSTTRASRASPPEYLYRQLVNFRDGRRTYPQMVYMSRHLSDEYLREIATYYSKLTPPFPTPIQPSATKEALARGEQIVRNGDQAKGIPACVACHGKALTGMLPGVPGPRRAVSRLHQWTARRVAQRPAQGDRARLHGAHRAAVERRRQRRGGRVPREHRRERRHSLPAPDAKQKLPMNCGSQPQ